MAAVIAVIAFVVLVALAVVAFGGRHRFESSSATVVGFCADHDLVGSDAVLVVVDRAMTRHASWRSHGGAAGLLVAGMIAVMRPGGFVIGVGVGGQWFPDVLVCVLGGVFVGVIAAESHHLRAGPGRAGVGVASLEVRESSDYVSPRAHLGRVGRMLGCVIAMLLIVATLTASGDASAVVVCSGSLVVLVTALVEWQQRRIVGRARPALPVDLVDTDRALRRLAIGSLNHAGSGLVMLLLANAMSATASFNSGPFADIAGVFSAALLVGAVVSWRRSRVWVVPREPRLGAFAT
jgi:hypothetical protein